jgi:uncharacterized damage-inducible protein DinB
MTFRRTNSDDSVCSFLNISFALIFEILHNRKREKDVGGNRVGDLIKKQFQVLRERLYPRVSEISEEVTEIQPEGFNNTIHWHVGHILVVTENFLFGEEGQLPARYNEWFAPRTKPADWSGEVPSVAVLLEQLKDQQERINAISNERFNEKLPKEVLGCSTLGELAGFSFYHETYHFGQIHAMNRLINASITKVK